MLTYKTHINKQNLRDFLRDSFPKHDEMQIAVAHENADETDPYEHTHVVIHFGVSTTISRKRVQNGFDFNGIHPHVKHGKGKNAWDSMLRYISKEDKDVGYVPKPMFKDTVAEIWNCETERDVLLKCSNAFDVIPFLTIWKHKLQAIRHIQYQDYIADLELNEYQEVWWDKLRKQNDRHILWIADCTPEGGKGKTTFGKWLRVTQGAEKHILRSKAVNFMYQGSEYVYINITRGIEDYVSYAAIEDLKDADMVSDKYQGRSVLYKPPKIIVFSNMYPDTSKMSSDRWDIIHYKSDKSIERIDGELFDSVYY